TSDGTTVYCGSGLGGYVYGVDGATGTQRWATKITPDSDVLIFSPVLAQGVVYAGFADLQVGPGLNRSQRVTGGVAAIDAASGRLLWMRLLPKPDSTIASATRFVAAGAGLIFAGAQDGTLYALDDQTGAVRFSVPKTQFAIPPAVAPTRDDAKVIVVSGATVVVGSVSGGTVTALSATDMHRLWIVDELNTYGSVYDIIVDSGLVYASFVGGGLTVSRISDGRKVWVISGKDRKPRGIFDHIAAAPAIDGDRIYLGGFEEAYALRKP
ncbi:MAG TPA: PQQ-binding-like beta-propeller repeat protein, partial [Gemmatimonadaceae bacterium]|nr:PQQ-binding-like beta-propeller repeat protein [Gemmatimonadaceae bacterium]